MLTPTSYRSSATPLRSSLPLPPDPSSGTPHARNEKRVRVTAKTYPEHNKSLIAATRVYYVKIWTSDPFPDDKAQAQWAVDSWNAVSDGTPLPDTGVIKYVSNAPQRATKPHLPLTNADVSRSLAETQTQGLF